MDKQRDIIMLVLQFYIKKGYTHKKKKKKKKKTHQTHHAKNHLFNAT